MDVARFVIVMIISLASVPAFAQTVHRCREGDTWVYQDRPCSGAQADAGTHTIRATKGGETPPAVKDLLFQAQVNAEREQQRAALAAAQAAAEPAAPTTAPPPPPRTGYRCTAGRGFSERVVYQYEPCPKYMEVGLLDSPGVVVSGPGKGRSGTVTQSLVAKVKQEEVSASDVCDGLRAKQSPYDRYTRPVPCR